MKKRLMAAVITVFMLVMMLGMNSLAFTNVIGKTGGSGANIRSEASTSGKLIGSLPKNTEFTICGEVKGADGNVWYLVFLNGKTKGYISSVAATNTGKAAGGVTDDNAGSSSTTTTPPTDQKPDDNTDNTPVVNVNQEACRLAALVYGTGKLEPDFSPDVYEYTLTVDESVEKVAIQAMTMDENAKLPDNYNIRDLQPGINDRSITVTGADGVSTLTYHFTVIRGSADLTPAPTPEPEQKPVEPNDEKPTEDTITDNTDSGNTVAVKTVKSGAPKWVVIMMAFVIIILIMVLVYVIIQMRDMREEITELNKERRRLRKKLRAQKLQAQEENGGEASEYDEEQNYDAEPEYSNEAEYDAEQESNGEAEYVAAPVYGTTPEYTAELEYTAEPEGVAEIDYSDPVVRQIVYREEAEARILQNAAMEEIPAVKEVAEEMDEVSNEAITEILQPMEDEVQPDMPVDDSAEEELEELEDRDSIGGDNEAVGQKEGWHPVNFLTSDDDMEFLDLDEDEEDK